MSRLINQFQYSHSRYRSFKECERKYYLAAYQMWDGWNRNASPEKKLAYRLNKQTNLPAWAGTIVHESIKRILLTVEPTRISDLRPFTPLSSEKKAVLHTIQRAAVETMRTGWRQALEKHYRIRPKGNLNLFELYYGLDIPQARTEALKETVLMCLKNFVESNTLTRIAGIPRKDWLETDDFTSFLLNGVKVALAIDFAYRQDGQVHIWDWKTGRRRDEHIEQVRTYALYAMDKWGVKQDIFLHLYYLAENSVDSFQVTDFDLISAQTMIEQRAKAMASKLRGTTAANQPLPMEEFAMTEDRWKCERCSFYESCYGSRKIEKR